MKKYLNYKSQYGVETVDYIDRSDFDTTKEYKKEIQFLLSDYRGIGMNVYLSSRRAKR